jgi:hypothetical protein
VTDREMNNLNVSLDEYYSGGYFLIRASHPGWEQLKTDLMPEQMVSLSKCIAPKLGIYWGWKPGDKSAALKFGIPQDKVEDFILWCNKEGLETVEFPSAFDSVEAARHFVEQFLSDTSDLYIIGTGLPKAIETMNWHERWYNKEISYSLEKWVEQREPLEYGGIAIGFEVVSFIINDFGHSWLCSGLDRDMHELFGIRPNDYGLINTAEEARKVYDWIAEDEMRGTRAEPEPYDFWLLVSYPLITDGFLQIEE